MASSVVSLTSSYCSLFGLTLLLPLRVERERCFISLFINITTTSTLYLYSPFSRCAIIKSISEKRGLCFDGLLLPEKVGMRPFYSPLSEILIIICISEKRGLCISKPPLGGLGVWRLCKIPPPTFRFPRIKLSIKHNQPVF